MTATSGIVTAVSSSGTYSFIKPARDEIVLVAGLGVAGDVHAGVHVRHRGRVRADPTQPNLRQVHVIHQELFAEVAAKGYAVSPGDLGENVTTSGVDLLALPSGAVLRFGAPAPPSAQIEPGAVVAVLAAAGAATLDEPTATAVAAVAAAAERERGDDPRPAVIVAGLRNPCAQITGFQPGLLGEVVSRDEQGRLVRKAGVMAVVLRGGRIRPGDPVTVELPPPPHTPLDRV